MDKSEPQNVKLKRTLRTPLRRAARAAGGCATTICGPERRAPPPQNRRAG